MFEVVLKLYLEIIVLFGCLIFFFQGQNEWHQGLCNKASAEFAKAAFFVRAGTIGVGIMHGKELSD